MTCIKFAIIWGALYAVLVAAATCFIAWGVPDFGAMLAMDRIVLLVVYVGGAAMWAAVGVLLWELVE